MRILIERFRPEGGEFFAIIDDGEWQAGDPMGLGATRREAADDLLDQLDETPGLGPFPSVQAPQDSAGIRRDGLPDSTPPSSAEPVSPIRANFSEEQKEMIRQLPISAWGPLRTIEPVELRPGSCVNSEAVAQIIANPWTHPTRYLCVDVFSEFPNLSDTPPEWLTRMLASPDPPNQPHNYWPRALHQREDDDL